MRTARLGILLLILFSSCKKDAEIEKGLTDEQKMLYQYFCQDLSEDLTFKKVLDIEGDFATVVFPNSSQTDNFWLKLDKDPDGRLLNCSLGVNYKVNGLRIQVWGEAYNISSKPDNSGAHNDYMGKFLKIATLKPI